MPSVFYFTSFDKLKSKYGFNLLLTDITKSWDFKVFMEHLIFFLNPYTSH